MSTGTTIKTRYSGNTFVARAGRGKQAKTSSSTSSEFNAAWAAARKFFGERVSFSLSCPIQDGPITSRGVTVGKPNIEIWFEDGGQDFLFWILDGADGTVVECGPFQEDIWVGCRVLNFAELIRGESDREVLFHNRCAPKAPYSVLKYRARTVKELQ